MNAIKNQQQKFQTTFINALANWQLQRWWWLLSASVALIMNLIAHFIFQIKLGMDPCEKCVYIRYAMFCIVIGGLVAAIAPKQLLLRVFGYIMTLYGATFGVLWSWQLIDSYRLMQQLAQGADPFMAGLGRMSCAVEPKFHFGLPLDHWFPNWFQATGVCGADGWSFLGLNMSDWMLAIFSAYIVLVVISVAARVISRKVG